MWCDNIKYKLCFDKILFAHIIHKEIHVEVIGVEINWISSIYLLFSELSTSEGKDYTKEKNFKGVARIQTFAGISRATSELRFTILLVHQTFLLLVFSNLKERDCFQMHMTRHQRFTFHLLLTILCFIDSVYSLYDHSHDIEATTIFLVSFITVIVFIIIFHCWMKRRPLHDVDWDEVYVGDIQRLAEQRSFEKSNGLPPNQKDNQMEANWAVFSHDLLNAQFASHTFIVTKWCVLKYIYSGKPIDTRVMCLHRIIK